MKIQLPSYLEKQMLSRGITVDVASTVSNPGHVSCLSLLYFTVLEKTETEGT